MLDYRFKMTESREKEKKEKKKAVHSSSYGQW